MARALVILLFAAASLAAQPYINYRGVVNAASYASTVAPGSLATLFGENLASLTSTAPGTPSRMLEVHPKDSA